VLPLDSRIDDLYKLPLSEFVAGRTALAKSLKGEDARAVKALPKPTVVPWAVNRLYWRARDVYTRMLKAGEKLREAQLSALKGRTTDVRGATTAHRQAVGEAAKAASRIASEAGARPDPEPLARMLEALSLQKTPSEPHGRFTKPLQPQGFEALAGVAIRPVPPSQRPHLVKGTPGPGPRSPAASTAAEEREGRRREQEAAVAARRHQAALKTAEASVERAKSLETKLRSEWERAKKHLDEAARAAADLRNRIPFVKK
jgi:hypothetical protein